MTLANQNWFNRPETRLRALGYDTNLNPARRAENTVLSRDGIFQTLLANGGLEELQSRVISIGTRLVRFGSGVLVPNVASGEWWLDWDGYKLVERYADDAGLSVPVAIRLLCCVPLEWNNMTLVIQAEAMQPLLAYEGFGASATKQHGNEHLDAGKAKSLGLKQLFIPGLSDPDLRREAVFITAYGLLPHELSKAGYFPRQMP